MNFEKIEKALKERGYKVSCFETAKEAAEYLNKVIDKTEVSFGGSITLKDMGLFESLSTHNGVYSHWNVPEGCNADEIREKAMKTEVYLSSVNGIAETGEIVNIDGTGNRVASTIFGHKRLYYVVGKNKIAEDFEKALWRARNIASPRNAQRLKAATPCAVDGKCHDCRSPQKICRACVVFWAPTKGTDTEIVLINEDLGY